MKEKKHLPCRLVNIQSITNTLDFTTIKMPHWMTIISKGTNQYQDFIVKLHSRNLKHKPCDSDQLILSGLSHCIMF